MIKLTTILSEIKNFANPKIFLIPTGDENEYSPQVPPSLKHDNNFIGWLGEGQFIIDINIGDEEDERLFNEFKEKLNKIKIPFEETDNTYTKFIKIPKEYTLIKKFK